MLHVDMIRSVKHKGLKRLLEDGDRSRLPADMADRIENMLTALNDALAIEELDRPSYRLHQLKGDLKGHYAITVRANWRITFRFEDGEVLDVDFVDYH
jgi:proteic killer suppression protein